MIVIGTVTMMAVIGNGGRIRVISLDAITQRRRHTHQWQQCIADLDGNCLLYLLCEARAGTFGEPCAHTLHQPSRGIDELRPGRHQHIAGSYYH